MQSTPNLNSNNVIPVYGANSDPYKAPPTDTQRENGVVPLDSLPAEWWNWLWNSTTMNLGEAAQDFNILYTELVNLMTAAGITPSSSSAENVKDAVIALTQAIGDATNPGAVKSSTASGKVAIASDGTCTVNGLGTPSLLDLGDDVVDAINQLNAAVGTVTSTVDGKNIKITYTHNNALSINDNSPVLNEVTSDNTNGIKTVTTTSANQFWSYIWGKIKTALGIGTNAKGGTKQPVYFAADGTVTATTETVGSTNKPTYRNAGTETEVSDNSVLVNLASTTAASTYASAPRPGVTGTLPVANGGTGAATADAYKKAIIDMIYPVGSTFISIVATVTPPTATGVTWEKSTNTGYLYNVGSALTSYQYYYIYVYNPDTGTGGGVRVSVKIYPQSGPTVSNQRFTKAISSSQAWSSITMASADSVVYSTSATSDSTRCTAAEGHVKELMGIGSSSASKIATSAALNIGQIPAHTHSYTKSSVTTTQGHGSYTPHVTGCSGSSATTGSTGSGAKHAHPHDPILCHMWIRTA